MNRSRKTCWLPHRELSYALISLRLFFLNVTCGGVYLLTPYFSPAGTTRIFRAPSALSLLHSLCRNIGFVTSSRLGLLFLWPVWPLSCGRKITRLQLSPARPPW